ncbi:hypothetical protein [Labrys neptuniae]
MPNHDSLHLAKHAHRSLRRRIHAVLRMAHRVLGMKDKRLGVGSLTTSGSVSCRISAAVHASGGAVNGTYRLLLASTALAMLGFIGLPEEAWAQTLSCSSVTTGIGSIPAQNTTRCQPSSGQALQIISNQDGAQGATPEDLVLGGGGNTGVSGIAQFFRGGIDNSNAVFIQLGDPNRQGSRINVYANQMAIGMGANAVQNSFALGVNSNASVATAAAMGFNANANSANAVAIGTNSLALAANAISFGLAANASAADSIAFGRNAAASGANGIAMGTNSVSGGTGQNVSIGAGANANAATAAGGAVAIGLGQKAIGDGAVAIGDPNVANGTGAVALGANNTAAGNAAGTLAANGAVAIGNGNNAVGQGSVALGNNSMALAAGSLALGDGANASAGNGVAIGTGAKASGTAGLAIGSSANAVGYNDMALGTNATANGGGALAPATAFGNLSNATGSATTAFGTLANATGTNAASFGYGAGANGKSSSAFGTGANATGAKATALGAFAIAGTDQTTAVGVQATASAISGTALGYNANATNANDVALGANSTTAGVVNTTGATINGTAYTFAGTNAASTVSVGTVGNERTITNVAAGRISGTSTDAVNGSQLFATNQAVNAIGTSVTTIGSNVNNLGNSAASTIGGGTTFNTTTGTLSGFSQNINPVSNTGVVGAAAAQTTVAGALSQLNTNTSNLANIAVKYDAPGGNKITLGATGGVGAPAGGVTITNLANGAVTASSTDGVNGSQLFAVQQTANKGWNANTAAVAGSTGTVSGNALTNIAPGGTLTYQAGNNIAITQTGNVIAIATSMTPTFTTVTAGNSTLSTTGLTITGGPSVTTGGINAGGKTITNAANGAVTSTSTDVVNGSQLFATNQTVTTLGSNLNNAGSSTASTLGGGTTFNTSTGTLSGFSQNIKAVDAKGNAAAAATPFNTVSGALTQLDTNTTNLANAAVKYDDPTTKTQITLGGAGAAQPTKITNLANGTIAAGSTDAVSGQQLFAVSQNANAGWNANTGVVSGSSGSATGSALTNIGPGGTLTYQAGNNVAITQTGNVIAIATSMTPTFTTVTAGNSTLSTTGLTITGGPSVTTGGINAASKSITNVANGVAATDAVNFGQLQAVGANANAGWNLSTGGNTAGKSNVGPGGTVDLSNNDGNIVIAHTGPNATFNLASALNIATSVTVGNARLDTTGLTITGGPSVTSGGVNAGGKTITNAANGAVTSTSIDVVNGSQLFATNQTVTTLGSNLNNAGSSTASTIGGGTTYNSSTGTLSGFSQNIKAIDAKGNAAASSTPFGTVSGALTQLDTNTTNLANAAVKYDDPTTKNKITFGTVGTPVTLTNIANGAVNSTSTDGVNGSQLFAVQQTANKGWNLSTNKGATSSNIAPGGTVDLNNSDGNVVITQAGPNATFNLASALNIATSVTVGNAKLDTTGLTITGGPSVTSGGINAGGKTITNAANGAVTSTSTDVVNGSQLFATNQNVTALGSNLNNAGSSTASTIGGGTTFNTSTGTLSGFSQNVKAVDAKGNAAATNSNFTTVSGALTQLDTNTTNLANAAVKYDDPTTKTSITLNKGGTAVTIGNVANGVAANDAVNVSQLNAVGANANAGWNLSTGGNTAGKSNVGPGGTVDLSNNDGNIVIAHTGPNATFNLASALNIATSVTVGNAKLDTTGLTITGGPSMTTGGINAGGKTITNAANGAVTSTSTDVVNGSQLFATNQTVTTLGSNLNNAGSSTASTLGGGTTYNPGTGTLSGFNQNVTAVDAKGNAAAAPTGFTTVSGALTQLDTNTTNLANAAVKYDDPTTKNKITLGNVGTPVTIGNVANGVAANDAVNVSQLQAVGNNANAGWNLATNGGAGTKVAPGGTVDLSSGADKNIVISQNGTNATFALAKAIAVDSVTTGNSKLDTTGLTVAGGPSVTSGGINAGGKTITNAANGAVTSTSTDAVNGSQLFATNQNVTALGSNLNNAGSSTASTIGGGTTYNPGTGTLSGFNQNVTAVDAKGNAVAAPTGFTTVSGALTQLDTNTTNLANAAVKYDDPTTKTSITLNKGGTAVTIGNVANGVAANDAVNVSQLQAVGNNANAGWNLATNGGAGTKVAPGGTVDLSSGADKNIVISQNGTNATFALAKAIAVDSVTTGNSKLDTTGLTITGGPSVTSGGINAGGKTITNAANGAVTSTSTDVVTGQQLFAVGNNVNNLGSSTASTIGGGTTYNPGTGTLSGFNQNVSAVDAKGNAAAAPTGFTTVSGALTQLDTNTTNLANAAVKYDDSTTKNKITLGNAGTPVTIGNVANGVAANDAVNVSQLQAVGNNANAGWNLATNGGAGTKVAPGGTVDLSSGADKNIVISQNGTNATFSLANDLNIAGSVAVGNAKLDTTGLTIAGGPSVTSGGINAGDKKITNVANGDISSTSTDAVNGSQLFATNQTVTTLGSNLNNAGSSTASTIGGGSTFNPNTGTLSGFNQNVTAVDAKGNAGAAPTGFTTVSGALTQLDTNTTNLANAAVKYDDPTTKDKITLGNAGTPVTIGNVANGVAANDAVNVSQLQAVGNNANAGWNLATNGGAGTKVAPGGTVDLSSDKNIVISQNGTNATFALASNINVATVTANSVTTGNTTIDTNGLTINGGPSVTSGGIDAGGKKITNVANGDVSATSTDAVNGSQLFATNQTVTTLGSNLNNAGSSTASTLGGGATFDPSTGTLSGFNQNVTAVDAKGNAAGAPTGFTTVSGALTQLDTNTTNLANAAVKYDDPATKDKITLGNVGAPVIITNVANGTLNAVSTDAVNGSQLFAVQQTANMGWNLSANGTGASKVAPGDTVDFSPDDNNIVITKAGNGVLFKLAADLNILNSLTVGNLVRLDQTGLIITGGPSVTTGGINAGDKKITNVANGDVTSTSTDAVNGSQLFAVGNNVNNLGSSVATSLGGGSTYDPSTGTVVANLSYGGSTYTSVQSVFDKIGGAINGGGIKYFHANSTGPDSQAIGPESVAVGPSAVSGGSKSTAVGSNSHANSDTSTALGADSSATGTGATATGSGSQANGTGATSMGSGSNASGNGATAIGSNSTAGKANATAIGNGANASANEGDVALGSGSVTSTVVQTSSATINGTTYGGFAGSTPTSTVSVGSAGNERTITNVAAGQITATSTDAINGSQLYSVANGLQTQINTVAGSVTTIGNNVNNLGTTTATNLGGGAKYDPDTGKVSAPTYNVYGTTQNNVGAALTALQDKSPVQYSNPNAPTTPNGNIPTNSVTLFGTGGPVTLSNVANGAVNATSTQAINGSQLYNSASKVASALGGGSQVNADGSVTAPNYTVGGNSYNNVGGAIDALDKRFANFDGSIANLQSQVSNNLKEARQGIAQAMAASALRYDDRPGKISAAAGMSVYHRQVGLAAGVGWTSEDAKWRANVAGTYSPGGRKPDFGVMGGLSYTFN